MGHDECVKSQAEMASRVRGTSEARPPGGKEGWLCTRRGHIRFLDKMDVEMTSSRRGVESVVLTRSALLWKAVDEGSRVGGEERLSRTLFSATWLQDGCPTWRRCLPGVPLSSFGRKVMYLEAECLPRLPFC